MRTRIGIGTVALRQRASLAACDTHRAVAPGSLGQLAESCSISSSSAMSPVTRPV